MHNIKFYFLELTVSDHDTLKTVLFPALREYVVNTLTKFSACVIQNASTYLANIIDEYVTVIITHGDLVTRMRPS